MDNKPVHIGDGVYIAPGIDNLSIMLTANSPIDPTDTIYIGPSELNAIVRRAIQMGWSLKSGMDAANVTIFVEGGCVTDVKPDWLRYQIVDTDIHQKMDEDEDIFTREDFEAANENTLRQQFGEVDEDEEGPITADDITSFNNWFNYPKSEMSLEEAVEFLTQRGYKLERNPEWDSYRLFADSAEEALENLLYELENGRLYASLLEKDVILMAQDLTDVERVIIGKNRRGEDSDGVP